MQCGSERATGWMKGRVQLYSAPTTLCDARVTPYAARTAFRACATPPLGKPTYPTYSTYPA